MNTLSYAAARANLAKIMKNVCKRRAPVIIQQRGGPAVVMISLEEFQAMQATLHLLRSTSDARHPLAVDPELGVG